MTQTLTLQLLDAGLVLAVFAVAIVAAWGMSYLLPEPISDGRRLHYIEGLRGIAALAVLANHTAPTLRWFVNYSVSPAFSAAGVFGVQIFFCITGFLFMGKVLDGRPLQFLPFLRARARRLLPLYLFAVTLAVIVALALTSGVQYTASDLTLSIGRLYLVGFFGAFDMMIRGLDTKWVIGTIWTLRFEWHFYLALPVLAFLISRRVGQMIVAALTIAFVVYVLADSPNDTIYLFFAPGIAAAAARAWLARGSDRTRSIVGALVLGVLVVGFMSGVWRSYSVLSLLVVSIVFGGIVYARPSALSGRTMSYLGSISYSVYLLQMPLLTVTRWLLDGHIIALRVFSIQIGMVFGFVVALIGVSALSYRMIELPFMRRPSARRIGARAEDIATQVPAGYAGFVGNAVTAVAARSPRNSRR